RDGADIHHKGRIVMRKILPAMFITLICLMTAEAQVSRSLFSLLETPAVKTNKSSIAAVRESAIKVDFGSMLGGGSAKLSLTLFDGKVYEAAPLSSEGFEVRAMDDFTWRGKIVTGKFEGDVVLTAKKGYLAGLIYSPEAVYEITPHGRDNILME